MGPMLWIPLCVAIVIGGAELFNSVSYERGKDSIFISSDSNDVPGNFLIVGVLTFLLGWGINSIISFFQLPNLAYWTDYFEFIYIDSLIGLVISVIFMFIQQKGYGILMAVIAFIVYALFTVVATVLLTPGNFCDNPTYGEQAKLANVKAVDAGTYPDTDIDHLIKVPEDTALNKANTALGGNSTGSFASVDVAYLQKVAGHYYWIVSLQVHDQNSFRTQGEIIPGYVAVDAEDPDKTAEFKAGYKMKYVPNALWSNELTRHVYENYTINKGLIIDDLDGLEVDDSWTPFYTGTLEKYTLGNTGKVIDSLITFDPQTGDIKDYKLNEVPDWVDRVYSEDLITQYMEKYAKYSGGFKECLNQGAANQQKIDQVKNVITIKGQVFQITLTNPTGASLNSIVYINAKTGEAQKYTINGPTASHVDDEITNSSPLKKINPAGGDAHECQIQTLLSTDVWYCVITNKTNPSIIGYSFFQPKFTSDSEKVVVGITLNEAYVKLRQQLAEGADGNPALANATKSVQFTGKVVKIAHIGANFIFLMEDKKLVRITDINLVAAMTSEGDEVTFTAYEVLQDQVSDAQSISNPNLPPIVTNYK